MLLILDIDGVLTDGKKYYDQTGKCVLKSFNDRDFTAIKKFKAAGWIVVFLSGDPNINEAIAKNRNIPFYTNRTDGVIKNKSTYVERFEHIYGIKRDEMVYVGDDIFDIGIMSAVKYKFCPHDSPRDVRNVPGVHVLSSKSGENCLTELFERLFYMKLVKSVTVEQVEILDRNERL